jgi:hypothetical protein
VCQQPVKCMLRYACGLAVVFSLSCWMFSTSSGTVTVAETRKNDIAMTSNDDFGAALQ